MIVAANVVAAVVADGRASLLVLHVPSLSLILVLVSLVVMIFRRQTSGAG